MKHTLALGSYVIFFAVLYVVFCCTTLSAQNSLTNKFEIENT